MKSNMRYVARGFAAMATVLLGLINVGVSQSASIPVPSYSVIVTFDGFSNGSQPFGGLVRDGAGNLYGTTGNMGVVFRLDPAGNETVLHTFLYDGVDGTGPSGSLVLDGIGNIYGTTASGGGTGCNFGNGCGVVYRVDSTGKETILHRFHSLDGGNPWGGLVRGPTGTFYGTTVEGGEHRGGVVFQLDPSTGATVLHSFSGSTDGGHPYAGLITDAAGNLYGAASAGGRGCGVVFEMKTSGDETVLYNFPGTGTNGCSPMGAVTRDAKGNLYGTTEFGGTFREGVVFKLDTLGRLTVLYEFTGGVDGGRPNGGLIIDKSGSLFGTTAGGGLLQNCDGGYAGCGVVFKIDPTGNETVLHKFEGVCPDGDGAEPEAGLLWFDGSFYGTTFSGGVPPGGGCIGGAGVVFKLTL